MPLSQASLAIMLRIRSYGEADRIATFLTRDFGKLTGIGKGAKNSRRRFPNCLEPFARVRVHFRTRPGASMAFLERCDLLHPATGMSSPSCFAYGSYLLELVDKLTHEADPISDVYDLLDAGLAQIETGPATSTLLRTFELQLLRVLGYAPPLQQCGACQGAFSAESEAFFNADQNLFLCDSCGGPSRASDRLAAGTLTALAQLQVLPLESCRNLPLPPETAREAAGLTGKLLAAHLSRPLRSLELIATLGNVSAAPRQI